MARTLTQDEAISLVEELAPKLDRRGVTYRRLERYKGECPIPTVIRRARVTNAYRMLMDFAQTNYGKLIIRSATSRMYVGGIRTGNKDAESALWDVWQENHMRGESNLAHDILLTHGRAFTITWPDEETDRPVITVERPDTVIVKYADGSRYKRVAALRRWKDKSGDVNATLYTADELWKFTKGDNGWTRRVALLSDGETPEEWPLPNPYGVVPVVELATNREHVDDPCGHALGDFEGNTGLIDRILVLDFLRLVIAMTSGFPIRAVIGDKIQYKKDDAGNVVLDPQGNPITIAPFQLAADVIAQFEDPGVKLEQLAAGDLKGFGDSIDRDIEQLAGLTRTPSYYMRSIPIQNVSADAIRASDAPLDGRVEEHKPNGGEGWQETLAVAGLMLPEPVIVPPAAEVLWVDRKSHSLSERADAATKLATVLPWDATAEYALDVDQETIERWRTEKVADALLNPPAPPVAPAPPAPAQP